MEDRFLLSKKNFPEEWRQFVFNWLHKEKVKKFFDMWSMHIHIKTYMKDLTLIWLYNILCKHKVFIAQVQVQKIPCLPCNFEVDCISKMNFKKTTNLLNNHQTNSEQLTRTLYWDWPTDFVSKILWGWGLNYNFNKKNFSLSPKSLFL